MKFALLGEHSDVLSLLQAIAEDENHQLQIATCLNGFESDIHKIDPSTEILPSWESVLTKKEIDVFILAGNSKESQAAARTIASESKKPFVVFPVLGEDWTAIYDLTYIQHELSLLLLPVLNYRFHPLFEKLMDHIGDGSVGDIKRIEFQKELSEKKYSQTLSQSEWDPVLLHAIDFLKRIGGNYHRVTSMPSGAVDSKYSLMNLTLAGDSLPDSQATFKTECSTDCWHLVIKGTLGEIEYSGQDDDYNSWKLVVNGNLINLTEEAGTFGKRVLKNIESSVEKNQAKPEWADLTYSHELLLGSHRSIKKRRTIEVHHDTTSERSQFKTQMTAVGCSLLVITLGLMIGLMIIGNVMDPRETIEIKATAANSIVYSDFFKEGSSELTEAGKIHVSDIASRFVRMPFPILIEQTGKTDSSDMDVARRASVLKSLAEQSVEGADQRMAIAKVNGQFFALMMKIGRVFIFVPLFIFLGFQFLLTLSRPSSK